MEKKEEHKIPSSTDQETETHDLLISAEHNTADVTQYAKNDKNGIPSCKNANPRNRGYPPVHQRPYTPLHVESPSAIITDWCQQLPHLQPNSTSNQGQPPLQYSQSTVPFWLSPRCGHQIPGSNLPAIFQTFSPMGTINCSWQGPAMTGVDASSNQPQVPNIRYPAAGPYPGFPGWDPPSWHVQGQQSQLPHMYTSPGGYGYISSMPPPVLCFSPSPGQSFQREIIGPTTKISQVHQQLWETQMQSAENVQLWKVIGHMQSELADYKKRLLKLEAKASCLKPAVEEPVFRNTRNLLTGQRVMRCRPNKSSFTINLPTSSDPHPRALSRKPAGTCKVQSSEARSLTYEKVIPAITHPKNEENMSNIITKNGIIEVNGNSMMGSTIDNQVHQDIPHTCDTADESEPAFSILPKEANVVEVKESSATNIGNTPNECQKLVSKHHLEESVFLD